jgi:hypothetical protein
LLYPTFVRTLPLLVYRTRTKSEIDILNQTVNLDRFRPLFAPRVVEYRRLL